MVTRWSCHCRENKGAFQGNVVAHSHCKGHASGMGPGPVLPILWSPLCCGPTGDVPPSARSTSPSPSLTAPRSRGRSPSTSPTSAVTAPRAALTASSSTSPGEPCPGCLRSPSGQTRLPRLPLWRPLPQPAVQMFTHHLQPQRPFFPFSSELPWLLTVCPGHRSRSWRATCGPGTWVPLFLSGQDVP